MTKLIQWLLAAGLFMGVWSSIVFDFVKLNLSESSNFIILALPIYLLMAFACYSLAVIGYRVATFNDCSEAAAELQQQIEEAKTDLTKKGMVFS